MPSLKLVTFKDPVNVITDHGASLDDLKYHMHLPIIMAKRWREVNGFEDLVITSTANGKHVAGSKHYTGSAFDVRTRDLTWKQKKDYHKFLKENLTKYYEVYLESDHIHIQYNGS